MPVTMPHMGHLYIPLKTMLEYVGLEVIVPPLCSKRTLSLGTQNSPEFACLPLKINLGNFLEARELGADTIVMAGGLGPCRFGYYAQIQREILRDLGVDMKMVILEPPDTSMRHLFEDIRLLANGHSWFTILQAIRVAWYKARAIDLVEMKLQEIRPREQQPGGADKIFERFLRDVEKVNQKSHIYQMAEDVIAEMEGLPQIECYEPVRIAIVGEIYTVLEPFVNLNMEKHLGRMGVAVRRSIYLSEWINDHIFKGILPLKSNKVVRKLARPYLNHFVGGHGWETVGSTVEHAQLGFDGVIQVAPLTCMPEIVAQTILPRVSNDKDIPVMTIYVDEQTGEAGLITRLEAFVDLIKRKKQLKKEVMNT
ncbi:MAG: CoA protein activase [Thermoanaerobacteraceae bacterium]|nr:CoA protein activase [Thermoanaerobacteraceae bacterium]